MHSVNQARRGRNNGVGQVSIQAQQFSRQGVHILFDAACIERPAVEFFEPDHWREQEALLGVAQGRGAACIFRFRDQVFVLRHYRRGGWMAKLSHDRYRWSGLADTRAWREWHLLAEMYEQGLPVPRPVAARVRRHGLFYSADLVSLCLPGVTPLADVLRQRPLAEAQWRSIGATIKRFHRAGVYHADLNARNILLDQDGQVFVIDFDKGARRAPDSSWQQANLARLRRSLDKFKQQQGPFHFEAQAWQCVLTGYAAVSSL